MTHVQFAQSQWLWMGALCCAALVGLLARAARLRRRALVGLAGRRFVTSASRGRRLLRQSLLVLGIAAAFTALARPRWGFRWEEARRQGIDLMFAVDTSKSMDATDLRPDRLTRAKLAVSDLLRAFPGERAGLIAFAGEAFVQAPMTIDQAVFAEALEALDTGIIPRGGTNIAAAVRTAIQAMTSEPDRRKILIVLSDGEDLQGEVAAAGREAARAGLVIYTVGVGTPAGEVIPLVRGGRADLVRDAAGEPVRSKLDATTLTELARATGGAYAALGADGGGLDRLYRQYLSRLPKHAVEERMRKVFTERFQLPLALAIGCLLLELAVGDRARRGIRRAPAAAAPSANAPGRPVVAVLSALLLSLAWPARAALAATAARASVAPQGDVTTYNAGTDAYRKKDFAAARERFQGATHTTDTAVQSDAYYDLGNARYRLGQASLAKDRQATIEAWKGAVAAYDGALALHKDDADARFNRDLVARRLKALEDEQRQQQQKQQDQRDGNHPQAGQNANGASSPSDGKSGQDQGKQQERAQHGGQGQGQGQGKQQGNDQAQGGGRDQRQAAQAQRSGNDGSSGEHQRQPQGQGHAQGTQGQEQSEAQPQQDQGQAREQAREQEQAQAQPGAAGSHPQGSAGEEAPRRLNPAASGESPQPPSQGQAGSPSTGPGVVSAANPAAAGTGQRAAAAERRSPGGLTRGEATQLLDSVAGELRRLPVATDEARRHRDDEQPSTKDW